jgi:Tol biopolymer transport system component
VRTLCVIVLSLVLAAPAVAQTQAPAKPQTKSLDSEAPPGAPPHWLPNENWVMQHWLPYDETRLYSLLGIDRGDVWRWLRDDTRTLAGLAQLHGWEPAALARELVAPWRGHLREPGRLKLLESRALRTLTQGHLSQHMFFHSLHQNAIPDAAPKIFGTSTSQFRYLRRSELSPLMICRLNGLSRTHAATSAEEALRAMVARAVNGQAMPAAQGERLLQRQLRQLPRWLQQTRYNGPPPLKQPRGSIATASNYSNNAAFAGDGEHLVYEAYDAKLAAAKAQGEIGVMATALGGLPVVASAPDPGAIRRTPRSAYNPAVSSDGRFVAFESAEGNLNFAKRYGQMRVYVKDLRSGITRLAPGIDYRADPHSAYNPSLSADGRVVAYETSESKRGELDVWVADMRTGKAVRAGRDIYEPALSPDGRYLAFTGGTDVFLRDLRTGATQRVSDGSEAWEPVVARGGTAVAYSSGDDVIVRDLRSGATAKVPNAFEPSLSADGRRVAFTTRGDQDTGVYVYDLDTGAMTLASRASGAAGAPAQGASGHPSISADGRRVAFTSDAWNLSPDKCNPARGIFVRDLTDSTTTLVSRDDGANRFAGPTKGSISGDEMRVMLLCA